MEKPGTQGFACTAAVRRVKRLGFTAILALAVTAGCSPVGTTPNNGATTPGAAPQVAPASATATVTTPTPARGFTAIPIASATPMVPMESTSMPNTPTGGVIEPGLQAFIEQAKADLARRTGLAIDQIEVMAAQSVTWPDGSLGCPQPGMAYTQVQVDGLLIRLRAGGREYEYHSGGQRGLFLCENKPG